MSGSTEVVYCDAIQAIGVHNGSVRISLIRLNSEGKPVPTAELIFPTMQVPQFIKALQQIR